MSLSTRANETLSGYLSSRIHALRKQRGWRVEDADGDDDRLLELGDECTATAMQLRQILNGSWTLLVRDDADDLVPGLAEQKAARKLTKVLRVKVEPDLILSVAQRLWGRSLTEEREERVFEWLDTQDAWNNLAEREGLHRIPPQSLQAHRGHETRALMEELEPAVEKEIEARKKRRRRAMAKEKKR
jgi:hypothetical protein